ncbi:hypothetical protein, partial [Citrobacter sp. C411]|uniref:hypothetical protein n=1 Tax=Citrobacter sp. C411 TaxID=3048144 RepID=UPI0039C00CE5
MKVIIFAKIISVNLAVENKVINVITIFENSSGNENHDKSIMEEPLNSAKPSNKLNIKDNNLINTAVSSVDTYLSTTGTTNITSGTVTGASSVSATVAISATRETLADNCSANSSSGHSYRTTFNGPTNHSTKDSISTLNCAWITVNVCRCISP